MDPQSASRPPELALIARDVKACRLCEGLNIPASTESSPGAGDPMSPVVIIGQSLCGKKCIEAQIPFTGGSGVLLDKAFELAGRKKCELFITNVVHCHPPKNRASLPHEITNCAPFLVRELDLVDPLLIITLGRDAARNSRAWSDARGWAATTEWSPETKPRTVLNLTHPSWVRRHRGDFQAHWIAGLARAIAWAFLDTTKSDSAPVAVNTWLNLPTFAEIRGGMENTLIEDD